MKKEKSIKEQRELARVTIDPSDDIPTCKECFCELTCKEVELYKDQCELCVEMSMD